MGLASGPRGTRLRPMSIGEILDESFRVYRRGFVPFAIAMSIVEVPTTLVASAVDIANGQFNVPWTTRLSEPTSDAGLLVLVVSVVLGLLADGAVIAIASDVILGRQTTILTAFRQTLRRMRSLILAQILVFGLLILMAVTVLGIPFAVYVGLGWLLVDQAVVIEGRGALDAMRRSHRLVRSHRWRLLICLLLVSVLSWLLAQSPGALVTLIFTFWLDPADGVQMGLVNAASVALDTVGRIVFASITGIVTTMLYYDVRVRDEALDLELRAAPPEEPLA